MSSKAPNRERLFFACFVFVGIFLVPSLSSARIYEDVYISKAGELLKVGFLKKIIMKSKV